MKKCSKCEDEKELDQFGKRKLNKDGLHYWCKKCIGEDTIIRKNYRKNYNKISKEKILNYNKNNKKKLLFQNKLWKINNKERVKELSKIHNSKKTKEQIKESNINQIKNGYKKNWSKYQYANNIQYKLSQILRIRFLDALKSKANKTKSVLTLLGCSIKEFKLHLEQQFKPEMNWSNHGEIWEIDHIKPCAKFDLTKLEEQQKCFHYTNQQPLYKLDNRIKGKKY